MLRRQPLQENIPTTPFNAAPSLSTGSVVVVRTLSGFEVWLDSKSEEAERTESGDLLYCFATTSPSGEFTIVRVEIPAALQDATRRAIGPRFADTERFWHALAYDALTNALEEQSVIPNGGHLTVCCLTPAQYEMARQWT